MDGLLFTPVFRGQGCASLRYRVAKKRNLFETHQPGRGESG